MQSSAPWKGEERQVLVVGPPADVSRPRYWAEVSLHSFENGLSLQTKSDNWELLAKYCRKREVPLSPEVMDGVIHQVMCVRVCFVCVLGMWCVCVCCMCICVYGVWSCDCVQLWKGCEHDLCVCLCVCLLPECCVSAAIGRHPECKKELSDFLRVLFLFCLVVLHVSMYFYDSSHAIA